ncbi:unnamed protein product [Mycena citricolor]|uniref:Poly(A)-nuclease deadenylation complex subunit 2 n=1 Tax=Mycena citricolor TaxID=2018698 RepID=A0AAD2HNQ4_9AGAR|nr:unnamed protein product [Mycena citricolor]
MASSYHPIAPVSISSYPQPVTALSFDPASDTLWTGLNSGNVVACHGTAGMRGVSFPVGGSLAVAKILAGEGYVRAIGVAGDGLGSWTKGGVNKWFCRSPPTLTTFSNTSVASHTLAASSVGPELLLLNSATGAVLRQAPCPSLLTHLEFSHSSIFSGASDGLVRVHDPRTALARSESQVRAHHGGIQGLQVATNYIYTIGLGLRQSRPFPDPLVKVYDMRTMRALTPIPFSSTPAFLSLVPKRSSSILVASNQGLINIVDVLSNASEFYQLDISSYLTSLAVSPTGAYIASGDGEGMVHILSQVDEEGTVPFNGFDGQPVEWADPPTALPEIEWLPSTPLNTIGMPYYDSPLLSSWSPLFTSGHVNYPAPPKIPMQVLSTMKLNDNVAYAALPKDLKGRRNMVSTTRNKKGRFRSGKSRANESDLDTPAWESGGSATPRIYRKVEIEYSKFGVEDFDFGFYNKTEFSGLETHILNSYTNALVQVMHYSTPIRQLAKSHITTSCPREHCLLCELGFVVRMLEDAHGTNCQSSNFSSNAIELIDYGRETRDVNYALVIQAFHRFLLDHLGLEGNFFLDNPSLKGVPTATQLVGLNAVTTITCSHCQVTRSKENMTHILDLTYPRPAPAEPLELGSLVRMSLLRYTTHKATCPSCKHVANFFSRRSIATRDLPPILAINAAAHTSDALAFWMDNRSQTFVKPQIEVRGQIDGVDDRESVVYKLRSMVVQIVTREKSSHLVAIVKVPEAEGRDGLASPWYLFNDFVVQNITEEEALSFPDTWKEETEFRSDGSKQVLRPARLSLARVSVLRGNGPKQGVPFIDDHIHTNVCSALVATLPLLISAPVGDLDPTISPHTLTPLKVVYKKLRLLVDRGCIFIGHGLSKDFRIINIFVPPEQVIDTVDLYFLKARQRRLSLRFLSWFVLHENIQTDTHDSIEDARSALNLYKAYHDFEEQGVFDKKLEEVYKEGRQYNFKPPVPETPSAPVGNTSNQLSFLSQEHRNALTMGHAFSLNLNNRNAGLHPLPAPVVHAGFSVPQSKSTVLAGVQDAYWSDDEAEDAECPLCLEEMDISDLNFKPCICRFCWHHIKENLNKRCPACRRIYTDEGVEFKAVATQDHKRLTQQKKQRERERKELDALGRRHLANVRVVQRNVVYVVGIGPRFAKEELIPTLRSNEYFGQYGKITKILLTKRTPSGGGAPVIGLYITYHRREDAARAIAAVDGTASPGGGREIMRASYGTTKYLGRREGLFTKEDLSTLKHTMKATETRSRTVVGSLPKSAAWGKGSSTPVPSIPASIAIPITTRPARRGAGSSRQTRTAATTSSGVPATSKKTASSGKLSQIPSRPSTPSASLSARPASPVDVKVKEVVESVIQPSPSPAPSVAAESDLGSAPTPLSPVRPQSTDSAISSAPSVPPGIPAVPPGLSGPPGIAGPSRPPRVATASPQTPLLASQSTYQMSTAARALLDDVFQRRENVPVSQPFPDFDRTLQVWEQDQTGGFSFNLDMKLAGSEADGDTATLDLGLPELANESRMAFKGTYVDAFPALRSTSSPSPSPYMGPPGLPYSHNPSRSIYDPLSIRPPVERQSTGGSSTGYLGSFNPFSEGSEDSTATRSPLEDDMASRKVSRFGFARGRQGSTGTVGGSTSSPLHIPSPLASESHSFYNSSERATPPPWSGTSTSSYYNGSAGSSPLVSHAQPAYSLNQQHSRFHPFDSGVSEAQLRELIQSSRERPNDNLNHAHGQQGFTDPAIMAAAYTNATTYNTTASLSYGPPPGIAFGPPGITSMPNVEMNNVSPPPTSLSTTDFPALSMSTSVEALPSAPADEGTIAPVSVTDKALEKAERKAAKKAVAAEKAAERQRIVQEKAAAKSAERARLAAEKAAEKERLAKEKAELEQVAKEKAEKEKAERIARVEQQKALERQKEAAAEKEKAKAAAAKAKAVAELEKKKSETAQATKKAAVAAAAADVPGSMAPLLSRQTKKNKPIAKPVKFVTKEEEPRVPPPPSMSYEELVMKSGSVTSSNNNSRAESIVDGDSFPTTLDELLEDIHVMNPSMDLPNHIFFDVHRLNPASKMPLEYGPLVHALSALSVGGGSFAAGVNGAAGSGPADTAISSFQELLETLTQTISALLRLLPRTTWDESSYFDGVLGEMLKGGDYDNNLDDSKDNNVEALTLALERRARWMEVQLTKLEELHRDINTAAVRAVLSFNDSGWDAQGFLPRVGDTLYEFDCVGLVEEKDGSMRAMTVDELEKKLVVTQEAALFAETEVREMMEKMNMIRPLEDD